MAERLENLPFDEQVDRLTDMADKITKIVEEKGSMSSRNVLQNATSRHSLTESQAKFGLSYAQSSGRLVRDHETWDLRSAATSAP